MMMNILLAAISGLALALAFPPAGAAFLAWFAFVPVFFAVEGAGRRRRFLLGLLFGFVFSLASVYWVIHSMYYYGGVSFSASVGVMLILALYLSLFPAVFSLLSGGALGRLPGELLVIAVPALWTSLEYIRGFLLTGFPWVVAGYTQTPYLPMIQIADNTGVWGVSFIILSVNTGLFIALRHVIRLKTLSGIPLKGAAIAAAIFLSALSYGLLSMKKADADSSRWRKITAGIAQGSIDQGIKWDAAYQELTLDVYRRLTLEAKEKGAGLIVWPETAIPFYFEPERIKGGAVGRTLKEAGAYVLTGSPSYNYNEASGTLEYFNSAFLLDAKGDAVGRYDKIHLVPFGEYVPLKSILPVKKLTAGIGDFTVGKGPIPIMFEGGGLGVLICYESIFPEIARRMVDNGATVLVNITNDGWFGDTSAPYQHFQMSVLRAVENRSFYLRAANTGISATIDPSGRVREKTSLFKRAVIVDAIGLREGAKTFYTRFGDVFAYGCMAVSGVFIFLIVKRRK